MDEAEAELKAPGDGGRGRAEVADEQVREVRLAALTRCLDGDTAAGKKRPRGSGETQKAIFMLAGMTG